MGSEPGENRPDAWFTSGGATRFDGERYQERFDALAASGKDVHGEAELVASYLPESVLDAGCGTGRVAIELARRGIYVIGVDRDASMLAVAKRRAEAAGEGSPPLLVTFVESNLVGLDLEVDFDVAVMAGNVPLFTEPGTEQALVQSVGRHVRSGGLLVAGFQLGRSYRLEDYDLHCAKVGLVLEERYSTWDRTGFTASSDYAVSVHRKL
jgi:SAM-dependent methyltransferase